MQQDTTQQRTRRGYALLAGLFLLAGLIFNIDIVADWLRGYVDVVVLVHETNGVRRGSPVEVEGVQAGRITAVELLPGTAPTPIALAVRLDEGAGAALRQGSRGYTDRRRFIGEPLLRITAGEPGAPALGDGDTIPPALRPSLDTLIARGRSFPAALDSLHTALSALSGQVEERRPDLEVLVDRLATVSGEADVLRRQLAGGSLARLLENPGLGERVDRLREHAAALSAAAETLDRYGGDAELGARTRRLARRADRLGEELATLQARLQEGDGLLARARRDSAIQVAIGRVRAQIDSLRAEGLGFALQMLLP